jgi:hypothetical protein
MPLVLFTKLWEVVGLLLKFCTGIMIAFKIFLHFVTSIYNGVVVFVMLLALWTWFGVGELPSSSIMGH